MNIIMHGMLKQGGFKMVGKKVLFGLLFILTSSFYSCSVVPPERAINSKRNDNERKNVEYNYIFLEAHRLKLLGDYQNAIGLFHKCVDIDPERDAAWYELANMYFALELIELAEENAKKALTLDPTNKWYYYQLARILMTQEKLEETVELYEQLVERYPEDLENKMTLAGILFESRRYADALEVLNRMEEKQEADQISLLKHSIFIEQSEFQKAFHELNKLIDRHPKEMKYRGMLAELYSNLGMNKQALTEYQAIFEEEPDNYQAHLSIGDFYRRNSMFNEAMYHFSAAFRNEMVSAEEKVSVIYSLLNDSIVLNEYLVQTTQLVELLVSRHPDHVQSRMVAADFFIANQLLERAVSELMFLSDKFPENAVVWEQLIVVLSQLERYQKVIDIKELATSHVGKNPLFSYFSAYAMNNLNQHLGAIDELQEGINLVEGNDFLRISMMILIADVFHQVGEHESSDQMFDSVLAVDPDNLVALNNYAYYLGLRGQDLEKAETMSRKTIEMEPQNSTFLDTYAWVVFKKGDHSKALKYIELAIQFLDSEHAEVYEHYGDILYKNLEIKKAREYWLKALELEPDRVHLKEKLDE
jgi:tetratricopeptide (TPR) repeat protein